jgi:hypothetical protein
MDDKKIADEMIEQLSSIHEFCVRAKKVDDINKKLLQVISRNNLKTGQEMGKLFTKYFLSTFKNVTTDTRVLVKNRNYRGSITCGRFGFGIRESIQSSRVESINEIIDLMQNTDDVVAALNKHRRWAKADEFKKFAEMLKNKHVFGTVELELQLPKPVTIVDATHKQCIASDLRIHYSEHKSIATFARTRSETDKRISDSIRIGIRHNSTDDDYEEYVGYGRGSSEYSAILSNCALSDQFDEILERFEESVKGLCKTQQAMLTELDDDFGKYVLAESL